MSSKRFLLWPLWMALVLGACAGVKPQTQVDRDNDARLRGATLVLHEALPFEPGQVSLFIQHGKLLPSLKGVKVYQPYCKFELWTRQNQARQVAPDRFTVKKVVRDYFLVQGEPAPLRKAALRPVSDDWGRSTEIDSTLLYLHSDSQPDVYRLTCEHWNDVSDAVYLSPEQIQATLGERFSLELN